MNLSRHPPEHGRPGAAAHLLLHGVSHVLHLRPGLVQRQQLLELVMEDSPQLHVHTHTHTQGS